jgi:hypothetical protein
MSIWSSNCIYAPDAWKNLQTYVVPVSQASR